MKKIATGIDIIETTKLLAGNPWKRVCCFEGERDNMTTHMLGVDYSGIFHLIEINGDIPVVTMKTFHLASKHIAAKYDVYESGVLIRDGFIEDK